MKYGNILKNVPLTIFEKHFVAGNKLSSFILKTYIRFLGYPDIGGAVRFSKVLKRLDLKNDDSVLDIGCGRGFYSHEIAQYSKNVTGIDDGPFVEVAQEIGKTLKKSAKIIRGDVTKLKSFINNTSKFDKILSIEVLEHVLDDKNVFNEWVSYLNKNGVFVFSVPLATNEDNSSFYFDIEKDPYGHKRAGYTLQMIQELCQENGLELIEFESYCTDDSFKLRIKNAKLYKSNRFLEILIWFPFMSYKWKSEKVSKTTTIGYHSIICTLKKKI